MMELLALTITCRWWMLWVLVTIGSFIWAVYKENAEDAGGWFPSPPVYMAVWVVGNLVMWLIYFIVV